MKMDTETVLRLLFEPYSPWLFVMRGPVQKGLGWLDSLRGFMDQPPKIYIIRGIQCRTVPQLFDEFGRALSFPDYFGKNWDAFEECLFETVEEFIGVSVVFITSAESLLRDANFEEMYLLMNIFRSIATETMQLEPLRIMRIILQEDFNNLKSLLDKLEALTINFTVIDTGD